MNKIAQKIIAEAEIKAEEIRKEYKEKERILHEEHEASTQALENEYQGKLDNIYNSEITKLCIENSLNNKKKLLQVKQEIIADALSSIKDNLLNDRNLYARFMEAMVLKGTVSGNEKIIVSHDDRDIVNNDFIERVNREAEEKLGHETNIQLSSENRDTGGGLYLSEDRIEFNATLDSVFDRVYSDNEIDIIKIIIRETYEKQQP